MQQFLDTLYNQLTFKGLLTLLSDKEYKISDFLMMDKNIIEDKKKQ